MPEELGFEESVWNRGTIEAHQRRFGTQTERVDQPGYQLLSCSGLPSNEYIAVCTRNSDRKLLDGCDLLAQCRPWSHWLACSSLSSLSGRQKPKPMARMNGSSSKYYDCHQENVSLLPRNSRIETFCKEKRIPSISAQPRRRPQLFIGRTCPNGAAQESNTGQHTLTTWELNSKRFSVNCKLKLFLEYLCSSCPCVQFSAQSLKCYLSFSHRQYMGRQFQQHRQIEATARACKLAAGTIFFQSDSNGSTVKGSS